MKMNCWSLLMAAVVGATILIPPDAAGADSSSEVRDSTLDALKGRQVEVTTKQGLSAAGELAGFDDQTVTIIRTDNKLAVLPRADIDAIRVKTAPPPEPKPAEAEGPAGPDPAGPDPAANVASGDGQPQRAAANPDAGADAFHLPDVEYGETLGPRPKHPDLTDYERDLHVISRASSDYCVNGPEDPKCRAVLRTGAEHSNNTNSLVLGGVFGFGLGIIALGVGAWQLDVGVATQDAEEACEGLPSGIGNPCDDLNSTTHLLVGGLLTPIGGVLLIGTTIGTAVAVGRVNEANRYLSEHPPIAFEPLIGPGFGGLKLRGSL